MNEIKVGDYVRTKYGEIGIITQTYPYLKWKKKKASIRLDFNLIKNHGPNIIDLIEIGDYVNGCLINYIPDNEKAVYHDASDCMGVERFENKDIKTIVTKEQFEEMGYKV